MSSTPLLTDASRLSAEQNTENYAAGVQAHINGDWGGHYQIQIIDKNWIDTNGDHIPGSSRLRMGITVNNVDIFVVLPILPFTAAASSTDAPNIISNPASKTVGIGASVAFAVQATGAPALKFQWRKNNVAIPGAISPQLAFTNVQTTDSGSYDCVVSNDFGVAVSTVAVLTVSVSITTHHSSSFWSDVADFLGSYTGPGILINTIT